MYYCVHSLGLLVRMFVLPNPFDLLTQYPSVAICGVPLLLPPFILNLFMEPILGYITYLIVGLFYTRGIDEPVIGSILYTVFYVIHIALLMAVSLFNFAIPAVIVFIGGYAAILFLIKRHSRL